MEVGNRRHGVAHPVRSSSRRRFRAALAVLVAALTISSFLAVGSANVSAAPAVAVRGFGAKLPTRTITPKAPPAIRPGFAQSVDLTSWAPPAGDQGQVSSCVGWAVGYALMGWWARHDGRASISFSPNYVYNQINGGVDGGSQVFDAFDLITVQGDIRLIDFANGVTSNWTLQPTNTQKLAAAKWRMKTPAQIFANFDGSGFGETGQYRLKEQLASGKPVVIAMRVRPGFFALGNNPSPTATDNDTTGEIKGYHALLALGYDANGLIIQNSWGTNWGNNGRGRLSWDVVRSDVYQAYTVDGFANSTPYAQDATFGLRKNTTQTRTVTGISGDHDGGTGLTYELVRIGFDDRTFGFSWNRSSGTFTMRVPSAPTSNTWLEYRVVDSAGFSSRIARVGLNFVS